MKVGDLFVNIGIKGADVAVRSIKGVQGAMSELASTSLETKAAILAILYGLEKFTGAAGERGMELEKFANFTGLSAQKLQQWQYALKMSGVDAKDTEGAITSLQSAMLKMSIGEGAPKGMSRLSQIVDIDLAKTKDAFYMLNKLREYSRKEGNVALANETLSSFGLSPAVIQALRTSKINPDNVSASKILGQNDVTQLSRVNTAWLDLQNTMQHFGDKFVAKHGLDAIKNIVSITESILKLVNAFTLLGEKLKIFEAFAFLLKGVAMLAGNVADGIAGTVDSVSKVADKSHGAADFAKNLFNKAKDNVNDKSRYEYVKPNVKHAPGEAKNQQNNVHTTVINHGVKDAKEGAQHVQKAIKHAFYDLKSQSMVT